MDLIVTNMNRDKPDLHARTREIEPETKIKLIFFYDLHIDTHIYIRHTYLVHTNIFIHTSVVHTHMT